MKSVYGKAKRVDADGMNKVERLFVSDNLLPRLAVGEIIDWKREPFSLDLGGVKYIPDFAVQMPDGEIVLWEVKALASDGTPLITAQGKDKLEITNKTHWFHVKIAAWNSQLGWRYFDVV